jgi:uncharacterized Zn-binding protein involved in type VI secretion
MPGIHRHDDSRACGATTIVTGQSTVFAENRLISVEGDGNSDGGGALSASGNTVFINGMPVIVLGDSASPDALCPILFGAHCAPSATSASLTLFAY